MLLKDRRNGITEAVTVIILASIAIALTIAVALWIFKLAVSTARPIELAVHAVSLNSTSNELLLIISNLGSSRAMVVGLRLGNVTCISSSPRDFITLVGGEAKQLMIRFNGDNAIINNEYQWQCDGTMTIMSNVQYSGYILLNNGLQFPFIVTSNS